MQLTTSTEEESVCCKASPIKEAKLRRVSVWMQPVNRQKVIGLRIVLIQEARSRIAQRYIIHDIRMMKAKHETQGLLNSGTLT